VSTWTLEGNIMGPPGSTGLPVGGTPQQVLAKNTATSGDVGWAGPMVPLAGATMTGFLVLSGDPTAPLGAATKQYVDASASTTLPLMDGTAAVGVGTTFARADHVHPSDTSRLALAGGTMSGFLTLNADPTTPLGAATMRYVQASAVQPATVLPLMDGTAAVGVGTTYARQDHVHPSDTTRVPLAGATMTGFLVLNADPTSNLGAATKEYVDASAVPPAITTPLMDGTAAVGTEWLYARGDHVHPSDTSRVPLAGGAMTGLLTLSGDPVTTLGAATKQYVDNNLTAGLNTKVAKAGDTMTGFLLLNADPTAPLGAATKQYADKMVPLSGGSMNGLLYLSADPSLALGAATKQYVDNNLVTALSAKVAKAGDTMTGLLLLSGDPTAALGAATKQYVDRMLPLSGGSMTGVLTLQADPTAPLQASTKQYVDSQIGAANLWQGTYNVAQNVPNLSTISPLNNGYSWTATTANPAVPEAMIIGLPGIPVGTMVNNGDILRYSTSPTPNWYRVPGSTLTKTQADATYVALVGSTMTGFLVLNANPTQPLGAVTKQYVDASVVAPSTTTPLMDGTAAVGVGTTYARADHVHPSDTSLVPLAGGAMTGFLTLNADPTAALGAATKQYVDASVVAPSSTVPLMDGIAAVGVATTYTRADHVHPSDTSRVAVAGSTMTGFLTLSANPTAPLGAATKQYVDASVVAPATVAPLMDGTAAVGVGTTYARQDHVHPSDTSRLPLAGGTMTGFLTLNADPTAPLGAATKQYVDVGDATRVPLAGGTMTGFLTLNANPTAALGAATKQYVDAAAAAGGTPSTTLPLMDGTAAVGVTTVYARGDHVHPSDTSRLPLAGGTMTGFLTLNANPTTALGAATKGYVDTALGGYVPLAGGTMTGFLTLNANPTAPLGAATKQYVDASLVAPSTTTPLMDGTAAVGVSTAFARGDHVHPSDTSRLPLAGGTMTGFLILNANPTSLLGAATKQYVDTATGAYLPLAGGTMTGASGIAWGTTLAANPQDLSRHIMLWNPGFGFCVTGGTLNYNVSAINNYHAFYSAGQQHLAIGNSAITSYFPVVLPGNPTTALQAAPKQYVDASVVAPATVAPVMDGTAAVGVSALYARQDHVHPSDTSRLPLAGGAMTGFLTLNADPTAPLGAATKQYVDNGDATRVPLAGGSMTGFLTLNANPTTALQAATKQYVDAAASAGGTPSSTLPLMDGTAAVGVTTVYARGDHVHPSDTSRLALAGGTMTGFLVLNADPTTPTGAATKQYADTNLNLKVAKAGDTMTGGLVFANTNGSGFTDTSKHLTLYTGYGFGVTGGSLNYNVAAAGNHTFLVGGTTVAVINSVGSGVSLLANPTAALQAAPKQYVDASVVAPATVAPLMDGTAAVGVGTTYARQDHVHPSDTSRVPLAGGTMTGFLTLNADPTIASQAATKNYVDTGMNGLPSNTAPLMNGTAAPGVAMTLSRSDHVHPSDTSRLALAGGTMTGFLTLNANPTTANQAVTKQYVDAHTPSYGPTSANYTLSDADDQRQIELTGALTVTVPTTFTSNFHSCYLVQMDTNSSTIAGTYVGEGGITSTTANAQYACYEIRRLSNGTVIFRAGA
jgi:hypothetical protein